MLGRLTFVLLKHARSLVAEQAGPATLSGFLRSIADLLGALGSQDDRVIPIEVVEGVAITSWFGSLEQVLPDL